MGAKFVKDVLYPGRYRLADGRTVEYSAAEVAGMVDRLNEWKGLGLHVPSSWAHQHDAKPMTDQLAADRARNIMGFAASANLTPEGAAEITLDVPDDEDARQVPKARFVSPEIIRDWTDGDGKVWPGPSITHIAFVSRPVQHRQNDPVRLSLDTVWLSLGDYEMPEKDDKGGKKGGKPDSPAGGPDLKKIMKVLAAAGINLPDDTDDGNFMDRLYTAAIAKEGNTSGADMPETTTTEADQAPALMSLQKRAENAERALIKTQRAETEREIHGLFRSGIITRPLRDEMLKDFKAERLSLDDNGNLGGSAVLVQIAAYKKLPAVHLSHDMVEVVERPHRSDEHDEGDDTKLRAEAKERAKKYSTAGGGRFAEK